MSIPDSLREVLRSARQVCVLTGAGVSAESGVPTFREAGSGIWAQFDPQQLATPEAFERDPALVWAWYRWRRELVSEAEPNPGHHALARLARRVPSLALITQNVDGLHQRAGSLDVIEYHGNLFENRCSVEDRPVEGADMAADIPVCPRCGGRLRPGVVWFGEAIPQAAQRAAVAAAGTCDLFFAIGTSALVWPAAALAECARAASAQVVEINPAATPLSPLADFCLAGKSGEILPQLVDCLTAH